jgi:hypothetical protein
MVMGHQRGYRRIARAAWRARVAYLVAALVGVSALIALPMGTAAVGGTALSLNGSSQYGTLGTASQLRSPTFTVELWFKRTGAGAERL